MFTKSSSQSSVIPAENQSASNDRRRSVLHEGITIKGDLESEGIVEFGGTITGDLTADTLVLAEEGKVTGNIRARNVTISGVLNGTIAAVNVTFKPQARVSANVETQTLTIETGAKVTGHMKSVPGSR